MWGYFRKLLTENCCYKKCFIKMINNSRYFLAFFILNPKVVGDIL